MTRLLIQAVLILIAPSLSWAAAFNCAKSSTNVEQLICSSQQLSILDEQLAHSYRRALQEVANPSEVRSEQIQWLKEVRNKCANDFCLTNAYLKRIRDLSLDCINPKNEFDKLACSATDKRKLAEVFQKTLDEWKPYLTKISYFSIEQPRALSQWDRETEPLFSNWTRGCLTLGCNRARIAEAIARWSFPKIPYEALLGWIEREGGKSPLLARDLWKLPSAEATAVWEISAGRIYRMGPNPAWLIAGEVDVPLGAPAPFLERNLNYTEAVNLNKLVTSIPPWSWDKVSVAGITSGMRNSLQFSGGGGAKCSTNPLFSSIMISGRFPDPPDTPNTTHAKSYKLIEVREIARDQPIPQCAIGDAAPERFFPEGKETYKSNIVVDEIHDQFVRPDGTFWLRLSDSNWYRFTREMTSEAAEIGTKYYVFRESEFKIMLDKSRNIEQLDKLMVEAIKRRMHNK